MQRVIADGTGEEGTSFIKPSTKDLYQTVLWSVYRGWVTYMGVTDILFFLSFSLDLSYDEPRLTAWYGELPYTYSRLTMKANADVCIYA